MKKNALSLLLVTSLSATMFSAHSATAQNDEAKDTKIMVVERDGKPPFKRSFVAAKEYDVAQFEAFGETQPCEKKMTVVMRGKPPFKRSAECLPVVDVAQFEISEDVKATDFTGRPPFKRHQ